MLVLNSSSVKNPIVSNNEQSSKSEVQGIAISSHENGHSGSSVTKYETYSQSGSQNGKRKASRGNGEELPQTGESTATGVVAGVVLLATAGIIEFRNKNK